MWCWWTVGSIVGLSSSLAAFVGLAVLCVAAGLHRQFPWGHGRWASITSVAAAAGLAFSPFRSALSPHTLAASVCIMLATAVLSLCWVALATAGRRTAEVRGRFFVDTIAVRQWQVGNRSADDELPGAVERVSLAALEEVIAGLEGRVFLEQLRLATALVMLGAAAAALVSATRSVTAHLPALAGLAVLAAATHAVSTFVVLRTLSDPHTAARAQLRRPLPVAWAQWLRNIIQRAHEPDWIRTLPSLVRRQSSSAGANLAVPSAAELPAVLACMPPATMRAVASWPSAWRQPRVLATVLRRLADDNLPWWRIDAVCNALADAADTTLPPHEVARLALLPSLVPQPLGSCVELPPWMEALLIEAGRSSPFELPHSLTEDVVRWIGQHPAAALETPVLVVAQSVRGNLLSALRRSNSHWSIVGRHELRMHAGNPGEVHSALVGNPPDTRP